MKKLSPPVKYNRPSKHENFMEQAEIIAKRSHDAETQVGCILVANDSGVPLGSGYNGYVRGTDDEALPNTRPDKYDVIVHSELNMLLNIVRNPNANGTTNSTLYCTMSPCEKCTRWLYQAGVTRVIVKNKYRDFETTKKLPDIIVEEKETEEGFFELTYSPRKKSK